MKGAFIYGLFSLFLLTSCNYFQEKREEEERENAKVKLIKKFNFFSEQYSPYNFITENQEDYYSYELDSLLVQEGKTSVFVGDILDIYKKDDSTLIISILMNYVYNNPALFLLEIKPNLLQKIKKENNNQWDNHHLFISTITSVKTNFNYSPFLTDYDIYEGDLSSYYLDGDIEILTIMEGKLLDVINSSYPINLKEFKNE